MPKVSILMPAYNAERYIGTAIESVLSQSYDDWELIIVDDASDDNTGAICERYASKDKRIKTLRHTENKGISIGKNEALRHASGDYIAFCDDDDIMASKTLEDNLYLVEENNAQIARWSYKTVKISSENVVIGEIPRICRNNIYHNREEIFRDYENVHEVLSCDWTGLYDRKFLNRHNIKFNEKHRYGGEDTEFNILTLQYVERMVMSSEIYYAWHLRKNHSTTAKRNINFCYSMIEVAKKEHDLLEKNCEDFEKLWASYGSFYKNLILDYAEKLPESDRTIIEQIMRKNGW